MNYSTSGCFVASIVGSVRNFDPDGDDNGPVCSQDDSESSDLVAETTNLYFSGPDLSVLLVCFRTQILVLVVMSWQVLDHRNYLQIFAPSLIISSCFRFIGLILVRSTRWI